MHFNTIVSTEELKQHLDDDQWVIIDCRHSLADVEWGRNEYGKSHIPGAYFAHLDEDLSGEIIPGTTGRQSLRHRVPTGRHRISLPLTIKLMPC